MCWWKGIVVKTAKRSSEGFKTKCSSYLDSLCTLLFPQSVRLFLLAFIQCTLFWCSVPSFPFSVSSTITLGLLLLHFGSHMISFTHRSPDLTSTTWLVVWGRDHRNCAHTIIKCDRYIYYIYIYIYIHSNANWLHCTISSLALRHSAKNTKTKHDNVPWLVSIIVPCVALVQLSSVNE